MEWIKCSDRLPNKKGFILLSINGYITKCEVYSSDNTIRLFDEDYIGFELPSFLNKKGEWVMPRYMREPEYWLEIPEPPK